MEKRAFVYIVILLILAFVVTGVVTDSDNDGLPDDIEISLGLDPNNPDTDGDGIKDGDEVGMQTVNIELNETVLPGDDGTSDPGLDTGTDTGTTDTTTDSDNDGLTDYEEAVTGTDPTNPDSDNDGISDGAELGQDSDNDGLSDTVETETGTNPNNPDSDNDGLTDAEEITYGTDPNNGDTDFDGVPDSEEEIVKRGGGGGGSGSRGSGTTGVSGGFKFTKGTDSDRDGLSDSDEAVLGTDPLNPDTDNDKINDLQDPDTYGSGMSTPMIIFIVSISLVAIVLAVLLVRKLFFS